MKKGRSNYSIQFKMNVGALNNLIQSYLIASNFSVHEKKGERYYRAGDQLMGYRGFKYSISGQLLTIEAWLDGGFGNYALEQNSMNMLATSYRNSLNILFQEISKFDNGGNTMNDQQNFDPMTGQPVQSNNVQNFDPMTGQPVQSNNVQSFDPMTGQPVQRNNGQNFNPMTNQPVQSNINQFAQKFQNETAKKQEKLCEIGFWISIFGVILSLTAITYGIYIYILDFYFAAQGLKTRKRGKAIATIVLSIISILIIIFQVVVYQLQMRS
jgi:hypothetical protein